MNFGETSHDVVIFGGRLTCNRSFLLLKSVAFVIRYSLLVAFIAPLRHDLRVDAAVRLVVIILVHCAKTPTSSMKRFTSLQHHYYRQAYAKRSH